MLAIHEAVSAVCPIVGVSVGNISDKATWRIDYAENATDQQRAAASAVVASYDIACPTRDHVNIERDRRLKAFLFGGKSFDFCDGKGSDINISGAGTLALAAISDGAAPNDLRWADPNSDFTWIAADNSTVTMDAFTCLTFAKTAASWKAGHIRAARLLKDTSPIPANYADNQYWP